MQISTFLSHWKKLPVVLLCLLSASPLTLFASPKTTLHQFYEHINEKRCEAATALRKDYSEARCQQVSEVVIHDSDIAFNNGSDSVMQISIDIYTDNAKSYFSGYVRLQNIESDWKIIGPYKSQESYTLQEYVDDYLPDAEIVLSDTTVSEQLDTEEVPVDNLDTELVAESEQDNEDIIPAELQKYFSGTQAISGNYTQLLNDLRHQLPQHSQDQVLFIDRSRLSLYLYDQNNLLISFFPILSRNIDQLPNGLFKTVNASETQNNENTPVHLIQLHSLGKSIHNTENSYYIRNLLDGETDRSLVLSPIDLGKLLKLLSSSTIIYLGN